MKLFLNMIYKCTGGGTRSEEVFTILDDIAGGFSGTCTILFFIILFLLLFWGRERVERTETIEVE